jgi:hypothetical protein
VTTIWRGAAKAKIPKEKTSFINNYRFVEHRSRKNGGKEEACEGILKKECHHNSVICMPLITYILLLIAIV